MELDELARSLRRAHLVSPDASEALEIDADGVERMLRHRPPMRLVDALDRWDRASRSLRGRRTVAPEDPVLAGHFPGEPVYPGVLQLEMMGQLGLCLGWLEARERGDDAPVDGRLLKIHHATFLDAVRPGDRLVIEARAVDDNPLTAVVASQAWRDETLCATCVMEIYFA